MSSAWSYARGVLAEDKPFGGKEEAMDEGERGKKGRVSRGGWV